MRDGPKLVGVAERAGGAPARSQPLGSPYLSLGDGWRLLRMPSSEAGIHVYYRALLGRPPEAQALLDTIAALHFGGATRFDVVASVARSQEARARRLHGPGLLLIRLAALAFRLSGARRLVLRRRAAVAPAVLSPPQPAASPQAASNAPSLEFVRRLASLEAVIARLESRVAELRRAGLAEDETADLRERVATLETTLLDMLNDKVERLRRGG